MKTNVIYTNEQIRERISQLGEEISRSYSDDRPVLCICVLRGAVMFFTELVQKIRGEVVLDFMTLSSYDSGMSSSGKVRMVNGIREDVKGKHVLIVEDIIDSGHTIKFLREYFSEKDPVDVKVACLLDKPMTRQVHADVDFKAFTLEKPSFVIGYGLDYDQHYRNLSNILEVESL